MSTDRRRLSQAGRRAAGIERVGENVGADDFFDPSCRHLVTHVDSQKNRVQQRFQRF